MFPARRSDLSAADGFSGPDRPTVGVELQEEQGESQTLLPGTHGERRHCCNKPHWLKGKAGWVAGITTAMYGVSQPFS